MSCSKGGITMGEKYKEILVPKILNEKIEEAGNIILSLKRQEETINTIAKEIVKALSNNKKVLLCGNGGSAADAQHIAAELCGKFYIDREPLCAIALTTNTSIITAIANDYDYNLIFSRQVKALAQTGDVVIGISTSGNSSNIILALVEANRIGANTIAFTGVEGKLKDIANISLKIESKDTPRIQEAHITAGHIICYLVEEMLYGGLKCL